MAQPGGDTEVLVVGAGPVGLCAALSLAERGVRVSVIDTYRRTALRSYALALHADNLARLQKLGVYDELLQKGQRLDQLGVYVSGELQATVDLTSVGGDTPFVLSLPQSTLEASLEQRLAERGVEVQWGHQLLAFDVEQDSVTVLVGRFPAPEDFETGAAAVDVTTQRISSQYLIGADGSNSLVRRLVGIPCVPAGNPMLYGLIECASRPAPTDRLSISFLGDRIDSLWPLGAGRARWSLHIEDGESAPDASGLKRLARERAPWSTQEMESIEWSSVVRFDPRMAGSFGHDRVWLAGDAAHSTSPIAALSLNVGLREATDLAGVLADNLGGNGSPQDLLCYEDERVREWTQLLRCQKDIRVTGDAPDWVHQRAGQLITSLPASGPGLERLLDQLGVRLRPESTETPGQIPHDRSTLPRPERFPEPEA